jgi:hypothetical protein
MKTETFVARTTFPKTLGTRLRPACATRLLPLLLLLPLPAAVQAQPTILTQPTNQVVINGGTAMFSVVAGGTGPFTYQWQFNGTNLPAGVITTVAGNGMGGYSGDGGAATNAEFYPQGVGVDASGNLFIADYENNRIRKVAGIPQYSPNLPTFIVGNVSSANAGNYSVVISNEFGSITSSNATLTIVFPPSITSQPQSQTVLLGTSVNFSVLPSGSLPLTYQWLFNGANIIGATNFSYTMTNAQSANAGIYTVVISNPYGTSTSSNAILQVLPANTILWTGGSGDWNTATNWNTGAVPSTNDDVAVGFGPNITVTQSSGANTVNSLINEQVFVLSGGTLTVANGVRADNLLFLSGGTLRNTTVVATNGFSLIASNASGATLDGVTIYGSLDVGNNVNGASLTVTNGLVLNGTALVGNPTNGWYGRVDFAGSQNLNGDGTLIFGNTTSCYTNMLRLANGGTTLTIGNGIKVRGQNGVIGAGASTCWGGPANVVVVNLGTISADVRGGQIAVIGQSFTNTGNMEVFGGCTLSANAAVTLNDPAAFITQPGATVQVNSHLLGNTRNVDQYTPKGILLFTSGSHLLEAMSLDLGNVPNGYVNNFAYGTISLAAGAQVTLVDQSTNSAGPPPEAVYVNSLIAPAGSSLNLNGLHLYAGLTQIAGTITNGTISQVPNNGGTLAFSTSMSGTLSAPGALDEFTFFGRGGHQVTVVVDPGSANVLPPKLNYAEVQLFDPSTNLLTRASNSVAGASVLLTSPALPTDGTYRVRVRSPSNQSASTGNFLVTVWDSTPNTYSLVLNQQANGQITTPYSLDRWNFASSAGQQVRFNLINVSSPGAAFDLNGPSGWSGFSNITASSGLLTLPYSGNYTVTAHSTGGNYGIAYAFCLLTTAQTNLALGTAFNGTFAGSGQPLLFLINATSNSPMRISLSLGNSASHVYLYAKLGSPPTRSVYDYAFQGSISQAGDILIPMAAAGTWYVLVYAEYVPSLTAFSLQATMQSVFLESFTPSLSASTLNTLLTLNGAGFDLNTVVRLVSTNGTNYVAQNVAATSTTQLQAFFPSNSVPAGVYEVCVASGASVDCDTNTLTMLAAGLPSFHTQIIAPSVVGYHQPATIYVEYSNTGQAAMPAPLLSFAATQNGQSLAFLTLNNSLAGSYFWTASEQPGFTHTVQFLASGAVPGLLQPGETSRIPIYYAGWKQPWNFSYPQILFSVGTHTADSTDVIDWATYGTNSLPPGMSDTQWAALLSGIETRFGATWGSYVATLDSSLSLEQPASGTAYDATQLFTLLEQQLTGYGNCQVFGRVTNVSANQPVTNGQVVAYQVLSTGQTIVRGTQTDGAGNFLFTNLPAGSYDFFVNGYYSVPPYSYTLPDTGVLTGITLAVSPVSSVGMSTNPPTHTNESSPALTLDNNGTSHIVWQRGSDIWHASYNGTNWVATGGLPGATGQDPRILASSNCVNGTLPGLFVTWETIGTNNSTLNYAVAETVSATNVWLPSSPVMLNETNALENQDVALTVTPQGQVVAVWQKKQMSGTDDTDLYYALLSPNTGTLTWPTNTPGTNSIKPKDTSTCNGVSWDFGGFLCPSAIPIIGGYYHASASGQLCGSSGCEASQSGSVGAQFTIPRATIGFDVGANASWKTDPNLCVYVFESAEITLAGHSSIDIPAFAFNFPPLHGGIGAIVNDTIAGSGQWQGVNWPSWPPQNGAASVTVGAGLYGKLYLSTPWGWPIQARVEGVGSLGANYNPRSQWTYNANLTLTATAAAGQFTFSYQHTWSASTGSLSLNAPQIELANGLTITLSPVFGTTNVYGTNAVLTNVSSNITDDGRPALVETASGVTLLAWTLDSETPESWLGSRVLVATMETSGWSTPAEIPGSRGFNSDANITCDSVGRPLAVWSMASSAGLSLSNNVQDVISAVGSNQVVYSLCDGAAWSQPNILAITPGGNGNVALGRTTNGIVVAAWVNNGQSTNGATTNTILAAEWNGIVWSPPSLVATGQIVGNLSIGLVVGEPNIFWTEDFNQNSNAPGALSIVCSSYNTVKSTWSKPQLFTAGDSFTSKDPVQVGAKASPKDLFTVGSPPTNCCANSPPIPIPDPPPPSPPCNNCSSGPSQPVGSQDPNAKIGPAGFGSQGWVSGGATLPYTIEFENSTNATAPAQQVNISDYLDPNFDWNTFELNEIAFGNQTIPIPPSSDYFATNVPMTYGGVNFEVQIDAGIDFATGEVFADFYSIDPVTALPPAVNIGFLPPEDGTGRGIGHVAYFVSPKPNLPTGTRITNIADIQFDENPVIATDQADPHDPSKGIDTNKMAIVTIDNSPPTSSVTSLPYVATNGNFTVCWSGTDIGSGIVAYDVYLATNGGAWNIWMADTANNCANFQGKIGNSYAFYSVAYDGVGNVQPAPASANAVTIVAPHLPPQIIPVAAQFIAVGQQLTITNYATDPSLPIKYSLDKTDPAGASIHSTNGVFTWVPACSQASTTNVVTIWVTDSYSIPLSNSVSFVVVVGECLQVGVGSTVLQVGQTSSVPVSIISTLGLTNLSFTIAYPTNRFTNWVMTASNSAVGTTFVQTIDLSQTAFSVAAKHGQTFNGPGVIGTLTFKAVPGSSAFVALSPVNVVGSKTDGSAVGNPEGEAGRVVVIGPEPLLEARTGSNPARMLTLYGNPGATYALGFRTNLLGTNWQFVWRTPMTNLYETFSADTKPPLLFYRAWEFFADPPILELKQSSRSNPSLLLYGKAGTNYILQATTNLSLAGAWFSATNFTLTNSFRFIDIGAPTNKAMFFRAKRP